MTPNLQRYNAVAIVLHWAIATAIVANLVLGWWMGDAMHDPATKARAIAGFQLHKSLGLTVLLLSVMRLLWRFTHRQPPLPEGTPRWERVTAKATHWAFYALMITVPLSGWTYVSAQWGDHGPRNVPTIFFGLFQVPNLFDPTALTDAARKDVADRNITAHAWLAYAMAALLVLHVAAALKHHFLDRDRVLKQMLPAVDAGQSPSVGLRLGAAAIVLALGAFTWAVVLREPSARTVANGTLSSAAGAWIVDPASRIEFTGSNAGAEFRGAWTRWSADIRYDTDHPEASTIAATIDTSSGRTGVEMQEQALVQKEWFDVAEFPRAQFKSTQVGADGAIEGTLTIKDRALPITGLKAAVVNGVLAITGHAEIDRKAANLGMESDATGEYVSMKVGVDVNVMARPR